MQDENKKETVIDDNSTSEDKLESNQQQEEQEQQERVIEKHKQQKQNNDNLLMFIKNVVIPSDINPGGTLYFNFKGRLVRAKIPNDDNIIPGETTISISFQARMDVMPENQIYEIIVPENVQSGEIFNAKAGSKRVKITCPDNASPGRRIRFSMPKNEKQLKFVKSLKITVPPNVNPDTKKFHVFDESGGYKVMVENKKGNKSGDTMVISYTSVVSCHLRNIRVPQNIKPGSFFQVSIPAKNRLDQQKTDCDNIIMPRTIRASLKCSETVKAGEKIRICYLYGDYNDNGVLVPVKESTLYDAKTGLFETIIPNGITSGSKFFCRANGKLVYLLCLPNNRPGHRIFFRVAEKSNNKKKPTTSTTKIQKGQNDDFVDKNNSSSKKEKRQSTIKKYGSCVWKAVECVVETFFGMFISRRRPRSQIVASKEKDDKNIDIDDDCITTYSGQTVLSEDDECSCETSVCSLT